VGGEPVAVDQEVLQVPVVVGERLDDRLQTGDVLVEARRDPVDLDLRVDELAEVLEAVLVAALQVAPVEGVHRAILTAAAVLRLCVEGRQGSANGAGGVTMGA
jgi:hypothetical protein